MCDAPLSRSARLSFDPSQYSRRHNLQLLCVNRSPIWYGFRLAAQKVSGIVWTASGALLSARASCSLSRRGLSTRIRRLGDTGFEVLDLRTSCHFQFKSKLEDSPSEALNYLNLQSLTLRQEQVNAIRNVVENQRWPEVLKSRTSNTASLESAGPRANPPGGSGDENVGKEENRVFFFSRSLRSHTRRIRRKNRIRDRQTRWLGK